MTRPATAAERAEIDARCGGAVLPQLWCVFERSRISSMQRISAGDLGAQNYAELQRIIRELRAEGWHHEPARCHCNGSGSVPLVYHEIEDYEPCPYHAAVRP